MFQPHPFLARLYEDAQLTKLIFEPKDMPSLVPPVPWFSYNCGGNLLNTSMLELNVLLALCTALVCKKKCTVNIRPLKVKLRIVIWVSAHEHVIILASIVN
jgi:hypothetical protein